MSEDNKYMEVLKREEAFLSGLFEAVKDDAAIQARINDQLNDLRGMAGLVGPGYIPLFAVTAIRERLQSLEAELSKALGGSDE